MKRSNLLFSLALSGTLAIAVSVTNAETDAVSVAKFDEEGKLMLPENFDDWVFIGTSLGMGYSQADFDPAGHNMFQVVRVEPKAYQAYIRNVHRLIAKLDDMRASTRSSLTCASMFSSVSARPSEK